MCTEFKEQLCGAVASKDDMMELMEIKHREDESLWEFIKSYHWTILDLSEFNYLQALRWLKKGVKIVTP